MRRALCIFALLIVLFVSSGFIQKNSQLSSYARSNKPSSVDGKEMNVYYFGSEGCSHCTKVEPFVAQMEHEYGLQLHKFEIYDNRENLQLLNDYFDKYHVPLEERGIPATFILDSYIIGDVDILDSFEETVLHALYSSDVGARTSRFGPGKSVEQNLSLLSITVAALADSINPCSMAILLFLMTGLLLLRKREKALKVGYAFALSVFVANLLFGMGILATLRISNFSSMFKATAGSIAIVTGILLIKDCFFQGRGRFVMEAPHRLRPLLKRQLGKAFFGRSSGIIGIFLVGFLVTSLEVPCTGGPYFYVLAGMAEDATRLQTIPILLFYNAIFITPLILLSTLLYFGSIHVEKARAWKDRNKQLLNLIRGSIITCLGLLTIPTTNVIQAGAIVLNIYRTLFIPIMVVFSIYLASEFMRARASRLRSRIIPWLLMMLIIAPLTMSIMPQNTIFAHAESTSAADEGWGEWAAIPVEVNVQVDLEYEGDQATTSNILSEIEERGWRATVFVTGEFASYHSNVVRNIEDKGHQIAVHGWQSGEDLTILSYQEQLNLINMSFSTVRNAVDRPEYVVDFRPQQYRFNNDTLEALQSLGAESISGVFECDESFCKCWYAQSLGKITFPYPITTDFMAIPISSLQIDSEDVLLDDDYVFDTTDDPSDYLNYLVAKYSEQNETKEPLIVAVHASLTGADVAKLNAFVQFLGYVKDSGGKVVLLDNIKHHTAYITNFDATGPSSASADEEITISVRYRSNLWCPDYRFRIYGRYPGENWELLDSSCFFVHTGDHLFDFHVTIPRPPAGETTYSIRVVGRASFSIYGTGSCDLRDPDWPTYDSYEVMDELVIEIEPRCIPITVNGDHAGKLDVVFVPDDDYNNDITLFLQHVNDKINSRYGAVAPISGHMNEFNFYYVRDSGDANRNCGVPPDQFWDYCPFADVIAILHRTNFRDCSIGNHFTAEGENTQAFLHESGHGVFGLADEYDDSPDCTTRYFQPNPNPNIWDTQTACINDATNEYRAPVINEFLGTGTGEETVFGPVASANIDGSFFADVNMDDNIDSADVSVYLGGTEQATTNYIISTTTGQVTFSAAPTEGVAVTIDYSYVLDEDWNPVNCRRFTTCQGDWWKIDYNRDIMQRGLTEDGFGVACTRRVNGVFDQYTDPPVEGRAIILELNINNDQITELSKRVVKDYPPDHVVQWGFFYVKTMSFDNQLLDEVGLWDPRVPLIEPGEGPVDVSTDNVNFFLSLPYFYNGRSIEVYDSTGVLRASIDISMFAGGKMNGTVTDFNGIPVPDAYIQLSGTAYDSTFTDTYGNYNFMSLKPGQYAVTVTPPSHLNLMPAARLASVPIGVRVAVDFALQQAGSIAGTVTDIGGTPVPNVHLYLSGYEPPRYQTDDNGRYIILGLEAETYTINIDAPSYGPWYISVNDDYLAYGTSASVDVKLGLTTLVDFSQQPPDEDPPSINVVTPAEGQALQDGVTLGALVTDQSGVDWVTFSIREQDGTIIGPQFESMPATYVGNDEWQLLFDTTQLPDGYYQLLAEASDMIGNEGESEPISFSIRNWACLELLPASEPNKGGRTMPVKFSLRIVETVDPAQPFVWNEELTIIIYEEGHPQNILQESTFGDTVRDYRIDSVDELYITNFRTLKTRARKAYVVEIYRKDCLIGSFKFNTVK